MARRRRPSPLPPRDGVDATRVVIRPGFASLGEAVLAAPSCAGLTADDLAVQHECGTFVDAAGRRVSPDYPARPASTVYLYRPLPVETEVPFDLPILHRDDDLVVVDKPHFLATMPRGRHVVQSALVRLRRELDNDRISPVHRLDRLTAGVLLFTRRPEVRSAYQKLFAERRVDKEYLALAPADDRWSAPVLVRDRIEKTAGDLRARVVPGPVNAVSRIQLVGESAGLGNYRLIPETGRTHQLRVHMCRLGVPIIDDPLYPEVRPDLADFPEAGDFSRPLGLLAHRLAFVDPISGRRREFVSTRTLDPDVVRSGL